MYIRNFHALIRVLRSTKYMARYNRNDKSDYSKIRKRNYKDFCCRSASTSQKRFGTFGTRTFGEWCWSSLYRRNMCVRLDISRWKRSKRLVHSQQQGSHSRIPVSIYNFHMPVITLLRIPVSRSNYPGNLFLTRLDESNGQKIHFASCESWRYISIILFFHYVKFTATNTKKLYEYFFSRSFPVF